MGTLKKQTAVEWLIDELNGYDEDCEIFMIAKAMEKEQIIDAFNYARYRLGDSSDYYNEIYRGEK